MWSFFTRFFSGEAADPSAVQYLFDTRLVACQSQIVELQATIRQQHTRIERLRTEVPWVPLQAFSFFPQLPLEVRLEIWSYALRRSRLVRVSTSHQPSDPDTNGRVFLFRDRRGGPKSTWGSGLPWVEESGRATASPLLVTCHESRQLALTKYAVALLPPPSLNWIWLKVTHPPRWQLCVVSRKGLVEPLPTICPILSTELQQNRVYFQPHRDTLYLCSEAYFILKFFGDAAQGHNLETRNITSLAIPLACFERLESQLLGHEAPLWSELKELFLVTDEHARYLDERTGLLVPRGISEAPSYIRSQMKARQQKHPQMQFPNVIVMTESELEEHVERRDKDWPKLPTNKDKYMPWNTSGSTAYARPGQRRTLPWAQSRNTRA